MMPSMVLSQGGERRPEPTRPRYATVGVKALPPAACCHAFTRYLADEVMEIFLLEMKQTNGAIGLVNGPYVDLFKKINIRKLSPKTSFISKM